jgi:hypothetical protein
MSTDFKPVEPQNENDRKVSMTQFVGPATEGTGTRRRLQLTQGMNFLQVSPEQALELATALNQWAFGNRPQE